MKTKSLFISAFGVLAMSAMTLLSCTKDETEPTGDGNDGTPSGEVTAPVLSSDKESVVLAVESADQTAVTFSWTAAKDGESDADVSYTLYLNLSSKDIFTEPYSKTLGKGLTASFTNAELNTILVEELGAETESAVDIQALVYATPADESAEAMQSNKVTVNVTTYAEAIVFPDALVAAGSAIGSNDRALGTEIAKTGEGTYKAEGVRIWTSNDAALKFYPDDETSEWCVVAKATESWQDMTIDVEYLKAPQGGDIYPSRISGFTFGEYTVEIDLNAGTLTLTRTGDISVSDLELPDELYMRGDAIADNPTWDWELAKNMPLVKTSDKVYEAKNISLNFGGDGTMGFNIFTGYEADNPMLGMAAESANGNIILALAATGEDRFRPGTIGYENGVYNIKVDFNTQQMTLTNITEGAMSMMGDANPGGWTTRTIIYKLNDHEWEATGVNLTLKDGDRDLGFKIYTTIDGWWPYYGQIYEDQGDFGVDDFGKITSIPDQATVDASVAEHDGYDPAFYPSKFGYTSGTYTINVNTETMKVTLTKEE